ncbi:MAG: PfkB family carbohydrate kinase [Candidatus Bathyarchaeota archaeon]|nr:PfkB family carbohydrate kinase [Candidatus Bathyarchaeota archaeon]
MASLLGVGDNTFDRYLDQNTMYPGGNAVNVPVFYRRHGGKAAYLGWVGNDRRGTLLLEALRVEDVDVSRCRVVDHPTGRCDIELRDGDRQFMGSIPGARKLIKLEAADYEYVSGFDVVHTSIYSFIEPYLTDLGRASKLLSYDFSSNWTQKYLEDALPHVDAAFLSAPHLGDVELERLIKWIHGVNHGLVVVTRGERGSVAYDGDRVYSQGIIEARIVDTLGAGDSFIARILYETRRGTELPEAMRLAAESAAETCGYYGAWGHGAVIDDA